MKKKVEWHTIVKSGERIVKEIIYPAEAKEVTYHKGDNICLAEEIWVKGRLFSRRVIDKQSIASYVHSRLSQIPGRKINLPKAIKTIKEKFPVFPGSFPENGYANF